jgi:hypothetical protein
MTSGAQGVDMHVLTAGSGRFFILAGHRDAFLIHVSGLNGILLL